MCIKGSFYDYGTGDSLIDPKNYPVEIKQYLRQEEFALRQLSGDFDVLVEIGCMDGRYLEWSLAHGKKYLGVDIVSRYVTEGKRRLKKYGLSEPDYQIEICSAENIGQFFKGKGSNNGGQMLLLCPFNSFGNMKDPKAVISSLGLVDQTFLICSYGTDDRSNAVRLNYYRSCGYRQIRLERSSEGVRFISEEGLDTIAYHPRYVLIMCRRQGIKVRVEISGGIGVFYRRVI